MNRILSLIFILALLLVFGCKKDTSPVGDDSNNDPNNEADLLAQLRASESAGEIKVMSRNVYIGTDVDLVLEAENIEDIPLLVTLAYQQLLSTDFADRVNALADEIDSSRPHLIGLQEMTKFYIQSPGDMVDGGQVPATDKFLDFFELLMAALDARDADYTVAVMIQNANIELPMVSGGDATSGYTFDDVRIEDHDVILARNDVVISDPVSVHYDSILIVEPDLGLFVPRGYVAVQATINQKTVRFVNTHIEASPPATLRLAQVTQLLDAFDDETLPLIIAGDFNSLAPSGLSYQYIIGQGYTDAWLENTISYSFNPNGFTFGNNSSLNNTDFRMFERIDFIFIGPQDSPDFDNIIVLGDEPRERTSSGLWPSDHAGIVTKVIYQPDMGKVIANK